MGRKEAPSGAAYLVKLVHVIGQQIDDLAGSSLSHGLVTKAKCLAETGMENYTPTVILSHTQRTRNMECIFMGSCVTSGEQDDL